MKFSRETLKLSDKMSTGYTMPILAMGTPHHSIAVDGKTTPDYINDFCFEVLEDSGINMINCVDAASKSELDEIKELADSHFIGVCNVGCNILPLAVGQSDKDYETYLRDFCVANNPKYLSYINPLYSNIYTGKMSELEAKNNFIRNAIIVNRLAIEYRIPFWGSVQAGGDFKNGADAYEYYPSDSEFFWMVNVLLASGAKGIQYYPLVQKFSEAFREDGTLDHDRGGILGADGLPTVYWSYIRTANEQIADAGPMLLQSRSEMLIATGEATKIGSRVSGFATAYTNFRQLTSVESGEKGVIIGCLDFKNRTGFYVVNNDLYTRREVTLNFDGPQTVVITQLGNKRTESKAEKVTLSLAAGGAALVYLWKHLGD